MNGAAPRVDRWYWRFAGWIFVLNLAWETAHARLYTIWTEAAWPTLAFSILHCTAGDVLIAGASLALSLLILRAHPLAQWRLAPVAALTTVFGVTYTAFSEWMNITLLRSWSYAASMPTLSIGTFELGLTPLLQWLLLPSLALWLTRRLTFPPWEG